MHGIARIIFQECNGNAARLKRHPVIFRNYMITSLNAGYSWPVKHITHFRTIRHTARIMEMESSTDWIVGKLKSVQSFIPKFTGVRPVPPTDQMGDAPQQGSGGSPTRGSSPGLQKANEGESGPTTVMVKVQVKELLETKVVAGVEKAVSRKGGGWGEG